MQLGCPLDWDPIVVGNGRPLSSSGPKSASNRPATPIGWPILWATSESSRPSPFISWAKWFFAKHTAPFVRSSSVVKSGLIASKSIVSSRGLFSYCEVQPTETSLKTFAKPVTHHIHHHPHILFFIPILIPISTTYMHLCSSFHHLSPFKFIFHIHTCHPFLLMLLIPTPYSLPFLTHLNIH